MHRVSLAIIGLVLGLGPSTALGLPLISEVFYDAVGADNGETFVELYGASGASLDGLFLEGVNGANGDFGPTVTLSGSFPADGFFVVADDVGDGTTAIGFADLVVNFDFQNGPDSIILRSADTILDAVGYGNFGLTQVFAGEGASAVDPVAGMSLARHFANVDTDDNASDFGALSAPTPGVASLLEVPEPKAAALLASSLVAVAWLRRRAKRCQHGELRVVSTAVAERVRKGGIEKGPV